MTGKQLILPTILLTLLAGIAMWRLAPPKEPVYKGKLLSEWLKDEQDRQKLIDALKNMGSGTLPWLTWAAENACEPETQTPLVTAWMQFLCDRNLKSPIPDERGNAIFAIRYIDDANVTAIPLLARLLDSLDQTVSYTAAQTLFAMQPQSLSVLLHAANSGTPQARRSAVHSLRMHSSEKQEIYSEEAIEQILGTLINGLTSTDHTVRFSAVGNLSHARERGVQSARFAEVATLLVSLLTDSGRGVGDAALNALRHFTPVERESIEQTIALLGNPDPAIRRRAANALGFMDIVEQRSREKLFEVASTDQECRAEAVAALANFGVRHEAAIAVILAQLESPDESIQLKAMQDLVTIGSSVREAMPRILEALKTARNPSTKAAEIVSKFTNFGKEAALPYLILALSHPHSLVRSEAASVFRRQAHELSTPEAINALRAATKDSNNSVRSAATAALRQMRIRPENL